MHRNCFVCHVKLYKKSVSDHFSVDFLGKRRVFKLESLFRVSTLYIHRHYTSRSSLLFQLAELLSLLIKIQIVKKIQIYLEDMFP